MRRKQRANGSGRARAPARDARQSVVTYLSIESIIPDPSNPRRHAPEQIRAIERSIEAFGFNAPILVDNKNRIVAGHGRYEAARLRGLSKLPVIRLEHLSEAQAKAYMLADNKLTDRSDWDEQKLAIVLAELSEITVDFEIEATGFEPAEIDLRIQSLDPPDESRDSGDEFEVAAGPAVSRPGDLWTLGDHRLLCGDALNSSSCEALLAAEKAAAVFTDPPYNVRIKGHAVGKGARKHRNFSMASGEMNRAAFTQFLRNALHIMAAHSGDEATLFVCMDWRHILELETAIHEIGYEVLNICVWVKINGGMGSLYRSRHEFVFVIGRPGVARTNNVQLGKFGRNRTNVWNYPGMNSFTRKGRTRGLDYHPTVKPIAMVADAILDVTRRGDIVLDPFCGSGTIILAGERTGRRAYAIELDPLYVDIAIDRWQRMTGKTAIHVNGKPFEEIRSERAAGAADGAAAL